MGNFPNPVYTFDVATCSPYLSMLHEWISYENQTSIKCKASYARSLNLGGIMVFSLNSDDLANACNLIPNWNGKPVFPLTQTVKEVLHGG